MSENLNTLHYLWTTSLNLALNYKSKEECKNQESIQSSPKPEPGHCMGK